MIIKQSNETFNSALLRYIFLLTFIALSLPVMIDLQEKERNYYSGTPLDQCKAYPTILPSSLPSALRVDSALHFELIAKDPG